jgi:uroporphyrinogen decarboxylase
MNRRNRILTALNGAIPDRVPISFDSHGKALDEVLQYYGAADKNDLYLKAGIEGFSVWEWNAVIGRMSDGKNEGIWRSVKQAKFPLADCNSISDLERHAWPSLGEFDFSHIERQAKAIIQKDMVVTAGHVGLGYQMHNELRGNEAALFDTCDEAYTTCYVEHVTEFTLRYLKALLEAGKGLIEVVRADDDIGTMDRLMISPEAWRKYYKPAWTKAFNLIHSYGAKVWFHSCGYIMPLMEDLIEAGIDCWNPFPAYVKDNDHKRLKDFRKRAGKVRLVLDGGIDQMLFVQGTAEQVRERTKEVLDTFAHDGGLLIGPSQVFTEDIPKENIIAFFETALKYGA